MSNGVPRKMVPLPSSPPVDISTLDQVDHAGKLGFLLCFVINCQNEVYMRMFIAARLSIKTHELIIFSPVVEPVPVPSSGSAVLSEPRPSSSFLKMTVADQTSFLTTHHSDRGSYFLSFLATLTLLSLVCCKFILIRVCSV